MYELSKRDVEVLLRDRSPARRAAVAGKVATPFADGTLGRRERELAVSIFRLLARDVEVLVRQTLSERLKDCPSVPHDVALALARDVIEVADPMLRHSEVLTDDDLIDIIQTRALEHRMAVAERAAVSEPVCSALVGTGDRFVVRALVRNEGARLSESALNRVIDDFGGHEDMQESLVHRPSLPLRTVERLVSLVSDSLRMYLVANHDMPAPLAESLALETREQTIAQLLGPDPHRRDVEALVRQMARNDRLTPGIVLRALDVGDLEFFEHGIAARARIPVDNARRLLRDPARKALLALYRQARMPEEQFTMARFRMEMAYGTQGGGTIVDTGEAPSSAATTPAPAIGDDFADYYARGWVDLSSDER